MCLPTPIGTYEHAVKVSLLLFPWSYCYFQNYYFSGSSTLPIITLATTSHLGGNTPPPILGDKHTTSDNRLKNSVSAVIKARLTPETKRNE